MPKINPPIVVNKLKAKVRKAWQKFITKQRAYLKRRPHRSFKLTSKYDYDRTFKIEGYFAFSKQVTTFIKNNKRFFGLLLLASSLAIIVMTGLLSQTTYRDLKTAIAETTKSSSNDQLRGGFYRTGLMFLSTVSTGGFNTQADAGQQIIIGLILILLILATIFYIRSTLAGRQPTFQEVIYSCGAPIIAMIVIGLIMFVQLLPLFIFIIIYSAAVTTNTISDGVAAMMLYVLGGLMTVLSLYLLSSSFLAMIVSTLPGMTPLQAIRAGGDMAIGRRLKLIYRLLWQAFETLVTLVIIIGPLIALESWLAEHFLWLDKVPFVPVILLFTVVAAIIWSTTYVYFLYRRIIEDESKPA